MHDHSPDMDVVAWLLLRPCDFAQLVRRQSQAALLAANRDEARVLEQMLLDPRTFEAVMATMQQMAAKPKAKL